FAPSFPDHFIELGGKLLFVASDGVQYSLWSSDGSAAGTVVVQSFATESTVLFDLVKVGSTVFFAVDNTVSHSRDLWRTDGTPAGTSFIRTIETFTSSHFGLSDLVMAAGNGFLLFTAYDDATGVELWRSDGTAAGTMLLKNINKWTYDSNPSALLAVGGALFFQADGNLHGPQLRNPRRTIGRP